MFGPIGGFEILLIAVLALLLFGPRKLPEVGRSLGRAMGELRHATRDFRVSLEREVELEKGEPPRLGPAPAPGAQARGAAGPVTVSEPPRVGDCGDDGQGSGGS